MRTRIYIDGYNLYYGCLKGTPYKWLNLVELFQRYIIPRTPTFNSASCDDIEIKFFTAPIDAKAASDKSSVNDQRSYHAALRNTCRANLSIIEGSYSVTKTKAYQITYDVDGKELEPKDCEKIRVWKLEEKESDVNVAVEAVYDVITDDAIEQVVFVTNDTDLVPALRKIKIFNQNSDSKDVVIGLVTPSCDDSLDRKPNKSLSKLSDWNIKQIQENELIMSQLPCRVASKKGANIKPLSWFRFPHKVSEIITLLAASEIEGSYLRAWRWLSKLNEKPHMDGLPDVSGDLGKLLDSPIGLKNIMIHVQTHIKSSMVKSL